MFENILLYSTRQFHIIQHQIFFLKESPTALWDVLSFIIVRSVYSVSGLKLVSP